jgi:HD-GYP domain-containing protein (c-di-GMP phosphodiesterase class II)
LDSDLGPTQTFETCQNLGQAKQRAKIFFRNPQVELCLSINGLKKSCSNVFSIWDWLAMSFYLPHNQVDFLRIANSVCGKLEHATGFPFEPWAESQGAFAFVPSPSKSCSSFDYDRIQRKIEEHLNSHSAVTCPWSDDSLLFMLPLKSGGKVIFYILGKVDRRSERYLLPLADTICESAIQRRELEIAKKRIDDCIEQITSNFEELAWLRTFADHFEMSDAESKVSQIAQSTLPTLRSLTRSESIFLFGVSGSRKDSDQKYPTELLFRDGDSAVTEVDARALINKLHCSVHNRPIVRNLRNNATCIGEVPTVKACILARVSTRKSEKGWLLVVNKDERSVCDSPEDFTGIGNSMEFGTTEAGLVSSIAVMLGAHTRNNELFREKEDLLIGVIRTLINSIDAKDKYTCGHSDRVAQMSQRTAKQLGLSEKECNQVHMSGLLHDIGKIGVPDYVLGKPGRLTESEFALIQMHPSIGFEILKDLKLISYVLPGVLSHHEAWDGSGYPHKLKGKSIPLYGRIIAVADSYDAMTSDRPYRQGMPTAIAETIIREGRGRQWDPAIVDAFLTSLDDVYEICGTGPEQMRTKRECTHEYNFSPSTIMSIETASSMHIETHS